MSRESIRRKADYAKTKRCKGLIAVLEHPKNLNNIGTVVRNIDALGIEKVYIVDSKGLLLDDWQHMRNNRTLNNISASAIKWAFVKKFKDSETCLQHIDRKCYTSIATSPHQKGKNNILVQGANFTDGGIAIWFGNESRGLSEEVIDACKTCVQIEMGGIIESLNLGTATGIVLYEAAKQRRLFEGLDK